MPSSEGLSTASTSDIGKSDATRNRALFKVT